MVADKLPSDNPGISDEDARSLEVQDQLESAAREQAYQEVYGKSRKRRLPMREEKPSTSLNSCFLRRLPDDSASEKQSENGPAHQQFRPLYLNGIEKFQGVYGIVHQSTRKFYVGSSVDVVERLKTHQISLRDKVHHSAKLQRAWDISSIGSFAFVLIEEVPDLLNLRKREQHWIDKLRAFSEGFNSKSTADGPELSLPTHIDSAYRLLWQPAYESTKPSFILEPPTADDRAAFWTELSAIWPRKVKQSAIAALLVLGGVYGLNILYLGLFYYLPVILLDWPESVSRRADWRSQVRFQNADIIARRRADDIVIKHVVNHLGVPREKVAALYPNVPHIMQKRAANREKYRRKNFRRRY